MKKLLFCIVLTPMYAMESHSALEMQSINNQDDFSEQKEAITIETTDNQNVTILPNDIRFFGLFQSLLQEYFPFLEPIALDISSQSLDDLVQKSKQCEQFALQIAHAQQQKRWYEGRNIYSKAQMKIRLSSLQQFIKHIRYLDCTSWLMVFIAEYLFSVHQASILLNQNIHPSLSPLSFNELVCLGRRVFQAYKAIVPANKLYDCIFRQWSRIYGREFTSPFHFSHDALNEDDAELFNYVQDMRNRLLLCLNYNNFHSIPDSLVLHNLTALSISHNKLKELPAALVNLHCLKYLDVSHNDIKKLPTDISRYAGLEVLLINHNKIKELPKEIGNLSQLARFSCHNNKIAVIPIEIGKLKLLELKIYNDENCFDHERALSIDARLLK